MKFLPQSLLRFVCFWSDNTQPFREPPVELGRRFSIQEIKQATRNFHPALLVGIEYYGPVYKGYIKDDHGVQVPAAVRRHNLKDFDGNPGPIVLSQLDHPNLLSMIGYCFTREERVIIYEFMAKGSLDKWLNRREKYPPLSWEQRLKISIGAASGVHCLHTGAKRGIIHGFLKSSIILLDENLNPKVGEFRFCRIGPPDNRPKTYFFPRKVSGMEVGYTTPEYLINGKMSEKSDVYSFGIVLCEILGLHSIMSETVESSTEQEKQPFGFRLCNWLSDRLSNGDLNEFIDPFLREEIIAEESLRIFTEIARDCFNEEIQRPDMGEVQLLLEQALQRQEQERALGGTPKDWIILSE